MSMAIQPGIICHTNTDKLATNIILFTFTGNALRTYPIFFTKNWDKMWHLGNS